MWARRRRLSCAPAPAAGAGAGAGASAVAAGGATWTSDITWEPCQPTDLERLRLPHFGEEGWRCRLERQVTECRKQQHLAAHVFERIDKVRTRAEQEEEWIRRRERLLNESLESSGGPSASLLRERMEEMEAATRKQLEAEEALAQVKRHYHHLSARFDQAKDEIEKQSSRLTDSSALMHLRNNIKSLRKEIAKLDLRLGVSIHVRQKNASEQQQARRSRRRRFPQSPAGSRSRSESPA